MSLLKNQSVVRIVVRKEQELSATVFDLSKLYGKVCVVISCVCFISYNLKAVISAGCNECIMYT